MTVHEDGARRSVSRRGFLAAATALTVGAATSARAPEADAELGSIGPIVLGSQPQGLPARQHAWGATLHVDAKGNSMPPRFDRLLMFDVAGRATTQKALLLESRLRTLERHFHWGPNGLLFTASWGTSYFKRIGVASPIPKATRLASFEHPTIDEYDLCLHLASDDEQRLVAVERALIHGAELDGVEGSLALAPAFSWRDTRTGFVGAGLPAAHEHVRGIPAGRPVSRGAPLFMGFHSSLKHNQASEDAVTIADGDFKGGTTMHVSYMRLELDRWYGSYTEEQRIARMYSPEMTPEKVREITTDAPGQPQLIEQAIKRYGVIGHSQATALARRNNKPLILRRDFNTIDGGQAGLHFVAVQRSIDDFVVTRNAMNANGAHLENKRITATKNNGVNDFIDVRRRANYIMPSRADRSFPLLPGRETVLGDDG